jgi:hypothetical protein
MTREFMKAASSGALSSRSLRRGRAAAALAAALFFGGATGCGTDDKLSGASGDLATETPESTEGVSGGSVGSIELALQLGDAEFLSFSYQVSGGGFDKTGTIDVSGSETLTALIAAIPFGAGYGIALQGQSTSEPVLSCSGAATFEVTSSGVTPVPVSIHCIVGAAPAAAVPVPGAANLALCAALLGLGVALVSRKQSRVQ